MIHTADRIITLLHSGFVLLFPGSSVLLFGSVLYALDRDDDADLLKILEEEK